MTEWYNKSSKEILELLSSSKLGLSGEEARLRLKTYGRNKLPEGKIDSYFTIFLRQFKSPLIYVLFLAAFVVFVTNGKTDSLIILAVLLFNAIVGVFQEGKAQNTLLALREFTKTSSVVVRDGKELIVGEEELVVGDIIVLQEGEKVPADVRLISVSSLKVDEASLTGESEPILKVFTPIESPNLPISEQKNMVFKSTSVVSGNGVAVVVATGLDTEIGKIARKIETINTEIPLKTNIRYLTRIIIAAVSVSGAFLVFLGAILGKPVPEMLATVVALSVSVIPEGLPIVVTLVLASGVWRMSKEKVLVKKLEAVEALGQTRVVAVDKTGTITKNELVVQKVFVDGKFFDVGGSGYEPKGGVFFEDKMIDPINHPGLVLSGKIAALNAGARLSLNKNTGVWQVAGDPTEAAMLVFSQKIGFKKDVLEQEIVKIYEFPFDYIKKYKASVYKVNGKNFLTVMGAPEKVFDLCGKVWRGGGSDILGEEEKKKIESVFLKLAKEGFRVVAYAVKENISDSPSPSLKAMSFVGFLAMRDALRPEVGESVARVNSAGVKVVMITGDHKLTAEAIAKEAGIYREGDVVLTGGEIENMNDEVLSEKIKNVSVFARVTPEHKLRIIQAYRKLGDIIAMTGDGVNDAPSLVAADLGVAMGRIGTEVAKEASDIVLLDDNFSNIVSAVEEGRSIYRTIKKVILYLFSTSLGEVFTITGAILIGYPLPILPGQIIWLNFVTDGFLDVALAMEPKEKNLLQGKFERPNKYLIDKTMAQRMFLMAAPMAIGTLFLFSKYHGQDISKAWTISLTVLAVFQWFNAWNCRSEDKSIFKLNWFSNRFLIFSTVAVVLLQLVAVYNPFFNKFLHTVPLNIKDWTVVVLVAVSIVAVDETRKFLRGLKYKSA